MAIIWGSCLPVIPEVVPTVSVDYILPRRTHMSPEHWRFKNYVPFWNGPFSGDKLKFQEGTYLFFFRFLLDPHWTIMTMETAMLSETPSYLSRCLSSGVSWERHMFPWNVTLWRRGWHGVPKLVGDGDVWWFSNDFLCIIRLMNSFHLWNESCVSHTHTDPLL